MFSLFPSETAGDGQIRSQYLRETDGQGGGLKLRRVSCAQCGFTGANLYRDDHSGGSLAGDGALGVVTQQGSGPDGNQAHNKGGGCPLCGSKNYASKGRQFDEFTSTPFYHDRLR